MAISDCRPFARASSSPATFAHPMIRLKATDGPSFSTTDETIQGYCRHFILDRQARGMSETEIARRLGITRPGLYKMRLRLGIPRPGDQE